MKKAKFLVLGLCMLLSAGFFGEKCLASVYIYNNSSYSVKENHPRGYTLNSQSSINDLTVYATARPDGTNDIAYLTVYKNANYSGAVTETKKFPGGDPSVSLRFTLPKSTSYYALVSTEQSSAVTGKFSAYY